MTTPLSFFCNKYVGLKCIIANTLTVEFTKYGQTINANKISFICNYSD